jgi:hypothetical protein
VGHEEEGEENSCMVRWRNRKERDSLEYLGADGTKTWKWILKELDGRAWRSIVWTFIKLWLPQNVRNSLTGWRVVVFIFYVEHRVVTHIQTVNNSLKSYIRFCLLYGFNVY